MFNIVAPIYSPSVPPMLARRLLVWNKIYNICNHDNILKKTLVHGDGIEQVQEHISEMTCLSAHKWHLSCRDMGKIVARFYFIFSRKIN